MISCYSRSLCKPGWFNDLMLKSKVSVLHLEVEEQHSEASRKAILDYLLLDPQEQRRLEIQVIISPTFNPIPNKVV